MPAPSHIKRWSFLGLTLLAFTANSEEDFNLWLNGVRQEAHVQGISPNTVDAALTHVQPIPRVIELENNQPEFNQTFLGYLEKRATKRTVNVGVAMLEKYQPLFDEIEAKYHVPRYVLAALWSMESSFGSYQGDTDLIAALATLAYQGKRQPFFRAELLQALRVMDTYRIDPQSMRGSWAGAIGHMQFIPSTYVAYATDGDQDGKVDMRASLPDAMHSAANYLSHAGWRPNEPIAVEVLLPNDFHYEDAQATLRYRVSEWAAKGVRPAQGNPLPNVDGKAAIVLPQGWQGPAFMVFSNYDVIMDWNHSSSYVLTTAYLADRFQGGDRLVGGQSVPREGMSTVDMLQLQQTLLSLGFDPGMIDGISGARTQAAIRAYQKSKGLPADGYASNELLQQMQMTSEMVVQNTR